MVLKRVKLLKLDRRADSSNYIHWQPRIGGKTFIQFIPFTATIPRYFLIRPRYTKIQFHNNSSKYELKNSNKINMNTTRTKNIPKRISRPAKPGMCSKKYPHSTPSVLILWYPNGTCEWNRSGLGPTTASAEAQRTHLAQRLAEEVGLWIKVEKHAAETNADTKKHTHGVFFG